MKRIFSFFIIFVIPCVVLFLSGCQTLGGFAVGMATTVGNTVGGAVKDGINTWKALEKADKWFQEHYW